MEKTLSIIKPDAVSRNLVGNIISKFEENGLRIAAIKSLHLSKEDAIKFYAIHSERPFFEDLIKFMVSGPIVVMVLEGENAVKRNRDLMGATNPKEAKPGSIRALFAENIERNAVHGSDSLENAQIEINFFFGTREIL